MSGDCAIVVDLWKHWGKTTTVDRTHPTACCKRFGKSDQPSGIEGVYCTSDGKVTRINWSSMGLSGSIPGYIGKLTNLRSLYETRKIFN